MKIYLNHSCHKGDTFRELLGMWEESDYCEIEESNDRFCWIGGVGNILLYEYARFDFLPERWNYALFSNMQKNCENCFPWIFWSRHPKKLEKEIEKGVLSYYDRNISSIFLGKIENQIQHKNRVRYDWSCGVELFSMPIASADTRYPYTQEEYLDKVRHSKFGLVLPGYGPKCNREIEYLGLGTVPIYTEGCSLDFYRPMTEGVHYLTANTPQDVLDIVENITEEEWNSLSKNGRDWYEENCSRKGSFDTTKMIVESFDE